ncbi:hypothetical protein JHK82_036407 [Glycine max]|nr:hypothetical protein JHK85_037133 [Glycine max]KAG4977117.1 hypothetical protein JHK86_036591 [Glycine max]KAG5113138.1 hypothetical protein JHK82_036407 [Glycine max]
MVAAGSNTGNLGFWNVGQSGSHFWHLDSTTLLVQANEANCLYFAEGSGPLTIWDIKIGKLLYHRVLHKSRINTIDFNCQNPHIVATSSSDGNACTWDLRYTDADKLTPLRIFSHDGALQSAYFSSSGCNLATTSGSRAKWGWDDSYLLIGNVKRGVDVVSAVQRKTVMTLESPYMSVIPCRLNTHSYEVGMLVGATTGGQVYARTLR